MKFNELLIMQISEVKLQIWGENKISNTYNTVLL